MMRLFGRSEPEPEEPSGLMAALIVANELSDAPAAQRAYINRVNLEIQQYSEQAERKPMRQWREFALYALVWYANEVARRAEWLVDSMRRKTP